MRDRMDERDGQTGGKLGPGGTEWRRGGVCWDPALKGLTVMVNSIYNGWRMEDVWLDK